MRNPDAPHTLILSWQPLCLVVPLAVCVCVRVAAWWSPSSVWDYYVLVKCIHKEINAATVATPSVCTCYACTCVCVRWLAFWCELFYPWLRWQLVTWGTWWAHKMGACVESIVLTHNKKSLTDLWTCMTGNGHLFNRQSKKCHVGIFCLAFVSVVRFQQKTIIMIIPDIEIAVRNTVITRL